MTEETMNILIVGAMLLFVVLPFGLLLWGWLIKEVVDSFSDWKYSRERRRRENELLRKE